MPRWLSLDELMPQALVPVEGVGEGPAFAGPCSVWRLLRPLRGLAMTVAAAPPRNDYLIRGSEQATIPAAFSPEVITTRRSHHLPGSRFSVLIRFHSSGTWSSGMG